MHAHYHLSTIHTDLSTNVEVDRKGYNGPLDGSVLVKVLWKDIRGGRQVDG
jgi:hypothetical protein